MAKTIRIKMMDKDVELDLSSNILTQSTVKSQFLLPLDAVVSLSYEVNGRQKGCESRIVPEPCFLLPDGWPAMQFSVESDKMPLRPASPMDISQFTIPSCPGTPMSPYHPELPHDPAPSAKCFNKWMFFLNEQTKSTTICVHPRFFVTFRHGSHRRFNIGDNLKLYHAQKEVDEQTGVEVRVAKIFEAYDFILLKSESDVVDHKPSIALAKESEPFTLAGFGNDTGCLSYLPGSIHSVRRHYFSGLGPFILGTSRSSCGDSGGGVWGSRGLIGMNYGCTMMPWKNHQEAISEAAIFSPKNIISPAVEFEKAYMEELEKERKETKSPPNKKSCLVTVVDGCTLYGAFV